MKKKKRNQKKKRKDKRGSDKEIHGNNEYW